MARRSQFSKILSRPVVIVLSLALIVGAVALASRLLRSKPAATPDSSIAKTDETAPSVTKLASVKTDVPPPIRVVVPATQPAPQPPHHPSPPITPTPQPAPEKSAVSADTKSLIEQADAKRKQDDLISARKLLVDAIDTRKLSPADEDDVLRRLSEINEVVVFSPRKFLSDTTAEQYKVQPGDLMQKIAAKYDITWKFLGRLNGISDPRKLQVGKSLKVVRGPFHALVNKSEFTLDIYMGKPHQPGSIFLKRLRVGLGENDSTPTGEWLVETKLENPRYYNPRSEGPRVIEPDDPANPLGERWIALTGMAGQAIGKSSYGIHGTIDPASIGQKKSMGCIRMLNEDVELVYDMLISGKSTVTVVE